MPELYRRTKDEYHLPKGVSNRNKVLVLCAAVFLPKKSHSLVCQFLKRPYWANMVSFGFHLGTGCGSVGGAGAFDTRPPVQIPPLAKYYLPVVYLSRKDKNKKEKRPGTKGAKG